MLSTTSLKKKIPSNNRTTLFGAVAASLAIVSSASAAIQIYEPFDYASTGFTDDDSDFFGDGDQSGALGTTGAWSAQINNVEMEVRNEAMTFTDSGSNVLPTSGLSIHRSDRSGFTTNSIAITSTATSALTADNTTMWMSFLYEDEGFSGPDSSVMFASGNLALANDHSLAVAGYGVGIVVGDTGTTLESAYYNGATITTRVASAFSPDGTNENTTFLFAAKINWKPDGQLDEIFVFNITDISTEPFEASALASDTFDMSLVNQQSLDTLNIGETQVDAFDEIRFGTSFADVVGVPEPTSTALLGLGGLALLLRRRR